MTSRTVLIEEGAVQGAFDASLADRAPAHVGLCIGKLEVGARDFVLALVPFPDWNDDVADDARTAPAAAKRKTLSASGDTSPLNVDDDWIVEHATQVSRMLPGGLAVVGVYAFCSDASWRGSAPALTRAIVEVAEAEDERGARSPSTRSRHQRCSERLVLHLSSDTRKLAAKRCRRGNAGAAARASPELSPAEHKFGRVANAMICLEVAHEVAIRLPRCDAAGAADLRDVAERAVDAEAKRIAAAVALVEGDLRDSSAVVTSLLPRGGAEDGSSDKKSQNARDKRSAPVPMLRAELLCPPRACVDIHRTPGKKNRVGRGCGAGGSGDARVAGVIVARLYAYARENVGNAIEDLKADVIASLRARLDVLLDEAEAAEEDDDENTDGRSRGPAATHPLAEGGAKDTSVFLPLPRRAWAEWRDGCAVCDYLAEGESSADVVERCEEVLRWNVPGGEAGVKIAEATPAPRDGEASRGVGGDRRERRPSNLTSSLRDGPTTGGRGRDAPDAWKTSRAGAASSGASMALAALGAGAALVAAGLANLAVSTPECVGEMCERAMGG